MLVPFLCTVSTFRPRRPWFVCTYMSVYENSDKVLSVFDGALQKAAVSSLTDRTTTLIEQGLIEVSRRRICATPWSINQRLADWTLVCCAEKSLRRRRGGSDYLSATHGVGF